jgi:hypothetical protein
MSTDPAGRIPETKAGTNGNREHSLDENEPEIGDGALNLIGGGLAPADAPRQADASVPVEDGVRSAGFPDTSAFSPSF